MLIEVAVNATAIFPSKSHSKDKILSLTGCLASSLTGFQDSFLTEVLLNIKY